MTKKDTPKFGFSSHFEQIVVKEIIQANLAFTKNVDYLNSNYFITPHLAYFMRIIKRIKKRQGIIPSFQIIREEIKKDKDLDDIKREARLRFFKKLRKLETIPVETSYTLSRLNTFIKRQRYMKAFEEGLDVIEKGDGLDDLDKIFKGIINSGVENPTSSLGMNYFKDTNERLFTRVSRTKRYRLLIPEIDTNLRHGGMERGETVMWLAPPGTGKTMALVHNTKAWILQRLKGVYYSFQLPETDIAERLDSSFSGTPIGELTDNSRSVQDRIQKHGKKYQDSLIIKYFPRHKHSIRSVRDHIESLRETGFYPDFIVLDFLNYMVSEKRGMDSQGSRYFEGGDIAGEFIGFCQTENLVGAAGIQANRVATQEDLTKLHHVAESFGSAMEATLVISINRKIEERESETARLFVAKYSFGKDQIVVPINTNYACGTFYSRRT